MTKLPDPKVNGNAGSFFKNPVISSENAKAFWRMASRATLPSGGWQREAAAGWLIDQCQLKALQ
jgi:UDP-N-acetylmuramate dehydrogenase